MTSTPAPRALDARTRNWALTGLFLSMFVSMISMNVVGTSMPIIMADIGGTQATFTWVVMATSLASAISTPIWGKLSDLTNKKTLVQISLVVFSVGTMLAGTASDPTWLIAFRVIQGIGVGGLGALNQIILADIVSPRERGKYMGIMGAVMAVATVGGPLIGGTFTDTIGWRWNFYVGVPFAIAAFIVLQLTLHLSTPSSKVKIDYMGAVLISAGFSSLLIWITLAGSEFPWASWQTSLMVTGGVVLLAAAVLVELKADEPLIPLTLFRNRTFTLSVLASIVTGVAMFATAVYLGQYMQLARGRSVIESSLLTLPMMVGVLGSSTLVGQLISRTGKWKSYMVAGSVLLLGGLLMLGQLRYDTPYWYVAVAMLILGMGIGMTMQNLVLVVQNTVEPQQMGAASAAVTFFRTIGGSVGMSIMGTVMAHKVTQYLTEALGQIAATTPEKLATPEAQSALAGLAQGQIPKIADLPDVIRTAVESAYGHGIGTVFLVVTPVAILAIIAIALLPNIPLSNKTNAERLSQAAAREADEEQSIELFEATVGSTPVVPPHREEPSLVTEK